MSINGIQFRFIAEQDTVAWPETHGGDIQIINTMLQNFNVTVFSESSFGTYAVDTYSLEGFKMAYKKMLELCPNNIK